MTPPRIAHPGADLPNRNDLGEHRCGPQAIGGSSGPTIELTARLAEFERDPEAGYSWGQVKAKLKDGSWRKA